MKLKILIVTTLISCSQVCLANDPNSYLKGLKEFIILIVDIDGLIEGIRETEKLREVYYLLGYANEKIDNIAFQKILLANGITELDSVYDAAEIDSLKPIVNELIIEIEGLLVDLDKLKSAVSHTNQDKVDEIIQSIRANLTYKKMEMLKDINAYLYGEEVDLTTIKEEALKSKEIAEEASQAIKEAKNRIAEELT
jgi:hypothetical protein